MCPPTRSCSPTPRATGSNWPAPTPASAAPSALLGRHRRRVPATRPAPGRAQSCAWPPTGGVLAPELVNLTYETTIYGQRARRSSLWRKQSEGSGWRMYYHQATSVPSDVE
ncbi:hypothetical protein FNH04_02830 [Streptomyces phyllanthi]|uniref:DUF4440 domain-containing protein n=1 Tax=Streptomyces phyllanthi TaxID=1803180 RepID=A0A5N8VY08_9ACTN|nr:hypothetical protein [Streptomyces phyllanthi]